MVDPDWREIADKIGDIQEGRIKKRRSHPYYYEEAQKFKEEMILLKEAIRNLTIKLNRK